jgi:hypothetical protein
VLFFTRTLAISVIRHELWNMRFMVPALLVVFACGGKLSDEQRKRLRDGMEEQEIVRMSDSEITAASLEMGRDVLAALESSDFRPAAIDSVASRFGVRIRKMVPGTGTSMDIENQVIDAYVMSAASGQSQDSLQDNIQTLRLSASEQYDSLLYTRPIVEYLPDGIANILGVWNVYVSKKEIIRRHGSKY